MFLITLDQKQDHFKRKPCPSFFFIDMEIIIAYQIIFLLLFNAYDSNRSGRGKWHCLYWIYLLLQRGSSNLKMKHNMVSLLMQHPHCTQLNTREGRGVVAAQGRCVEEIHTKPFAYNKEANASVKCHLQKYRLSSISIIFPFLPPITLSPPFSFFAQGIFIERVNKKLCILRTKD